MNSTPLRLIALCSFVVLASGCREDDSVLGPTEGSSVYSAGSAHIAQAQGQAPAVDATVDQGVSPEQSEASAEQDPVEAPTAWPTDTPLPLPTEPPTATPDPLAYAGSPVRLEIPAIAVDATIEQVGLTAPPEQAMDVPKAWMNVGWYRLGARPGETGNAVIAGHLDTTTGGPAVFWDLNRLVPGDEVFVTYESGERFRFLVQGQQLYDHDADGPVIDKVFGPSQTPDLNLITCDGAWDHGKATYTQRLVVFTELDAVQNSASADFVQRGLN